MEKKVKKLKNFMVILIVGLLATGFFSSCSGASTSYTDEEKSVLIYKAIYGGGIGDAGGGSGSGAAPRTVTGGSVTFEVGSVDDFTGSQFHADVAGWPSTVDHISMLYTLSYNNLTVTVDDNGTEITVVLNGSIAYGFDLNMTDVTGSIVMFGNINGSVDGDAFNFLMDLKSTITYDGSTYTVTLTGTVGDVTINETYSFSAP